MDNKYKILFKNLAQATAASAEQVMEYDREKGDEKGLETATTMRDDYQELTDRLGEEEYSFTKLDAAKLLVAPMLQAKQVYCIFHTDLSEQYKKLPQKRILYYIQMPRE